MTINNCVQACQKGGYTIAGTGYSGEVSQPLWKCLVSRFSLMVLSVTAAIASAVVIPARPPMDAATCRVMATTQRYAVDPMVCPYFSSTAGIPKDAIRIILGTARFGMAKGRLVVQTI